MRRYLQGTLDFACGIYAVINALSVIDGLELAGARSIFKETHIGLAAEPALWADYLGNETDHYWLVRHTLWRWCVAGPHALRFSQPFSSCLLPSERDLDLSAAPRYLPEQKPPEGPSSLAAAEKEAREVWRAIGGLFGSEQNSPLHRAVLLRFHRFVPGLRRPVVSHWTTGKSFAADVLQLHDASSEPGALLALERNALLPSFGGRAMVRIVPESVLFLESARAAG